MLPTEFQFIWESSFREEDYQTSTNQKQEWPVVAMFVNRSDINEKYVDEGLQRKILKSEQLMVDK